MLTQIRMTNAERDGFQLFDDANLAVLYIQKDIMVAENAALSGGGSRILLTVNRHSFGISNNPMGRVMHTIEYYRSGDDLMREHRDETCSLFEEEEARAVSRFLSADPIFEIDPLQGDPQRNNQIACDLHFANPPNSSTLQTRRVFQTKMLSRDAVR